MKAFIIEDEPASRRNLERLLSENFPETEVVGGAASVKEAVQWLGSHACDIVFMDVELQDGNCFEIFRRVSVDAFVVFTTAYDHYAVKAFEVNSLDYLLKPIEIKALSRAMERCRTIKARSDPGRILQALPREEKSYKERFILRIGDRIIPLETKDIARIEAEHKAVFAVNSKGERYIFGLTLDEAEAQLDPKEFFRISRGCIMARSSIRSIRRIEGGRLLPQTEPPSEQEVARARTDAFLEWMEK